MIDAIRSDSIDPFINAGFWYSLFRTDQRPYISKINIPFFVHFKYLFIHFLE